MIKLIFNPKGEVMVDAPFIPGLSPISNIPLERFLPPLNHGMMTSWLKQFLPKGTLILDPFGNHPFHVLELAKAGYRVVVTANNPIHSFMLELLASNPTVEEFNGVIKKVSNLLVNDHESVEEFIRSFYQIPCPHCGNIIEASKFIWHKEEQQAHSFIADCKECGLSGEQTINPDNFGLSRQLPLYSLHLSRALESVVPLHDPLRTQVETTLNFYPKRPLILLQILLSKIASSDFTNREETLIKALILQVCDQVNTLWSYPTARSRPRQLFVPAVYQEPNLWDIFSTAKDYWLTQSEPVSLKPWPFVPPLSGGISLFKGRIRELTPPPMAGMFQAISAILPRPNQAFWTLSALWTGWLWGQDAVLPLKNTLMRQRYDWNWHANALFTVFNTLHTITQDSTPFFMLIQENENDFTSAAVLAAKKAGYILRQKACSGNFQTQQFYWVNGMPQLSDFTMKEINQRSLFLIKDHLTQRGEPATYELLHAEVLTGLAQSNDLGILFQNKEEINLSETTNLLQQVLIDPAEIKRFGGGSTSLETGLFWLKEEPEYQPSLIDKVEALVFNKLRDEKVVDYKDLRASIFLNCGGFFTPTEEMILACLQSYANPDPKNKGVWIFKTNEDENTRNKDKIEIEKILEHISKKLFFNQIIHNENISWLENNKLIMNFFITIDTIISRFIFRTVENSLPSIILLPGSRANLLAYKLKRDPLIEFATSEKWHFVKFRQIRLINENPLLTRELFTKLVIEDPPEYQTSQLMLF